LKQDTFVCREHALLGTEEIAFASLGSSKFDSIGIDENVWFLKNF